MGMTQVAQYLICLSVCHDLDVQGILRGHHELRSTVTEEPALKPDMLSQYLHRIQLPAEVWKKIMNREVSFSALSAICTSHAQAIPFENLDLVSNGMKSYPDPVSGRELTSFEFWWQLQPSSTALQDVTLCDADEGCCDLLQSKTADFSQWRVDSRGNCRFMSLQRQSPRGTLTSTWRACSRR